MIMARNENPIFDNSERYREIGYAISYYRKRKGYTQEQLAERIGISRQHMGAIEAPNMVRAISLDVLFNIAAVLEIEPYVLLKFAPDK
jgi:transcriptional regulator with XRE-family HTH domain